MELLCPACTRQLSIPQTAPGTALQCPYCGTMFQLAPQPGLAPAMHPAGHGMPYGGHSPGMHTPQAMAPGVQPSFATVDPFVSDRPARIVRRKKSSSSPLVIMIGLGLLLVAGLVAIGMYFLDDIQKPVAGPAGPEHPAQAQARQFVAQELNLPARAQWAVAGDKIRELSGGRWFVSSYVDVPGRVREVYVRQQWEADLSEADGKWTLRRLVVDGQVVMALPTASDRKSESRPPRDWIGHRNSTPVESEPSGPDRSTRWAVERVASEIKESVKLRKTLVVWLIDRSQSVRPQQQDFLRHVQGILSEMKPDPESDPQLRMAVVSFAGDVKFELEQPSDNPDEVRAVLEGIAEDPSGQEQTFAALTMAAEKYRNFGTEKSGYVLFVVVSDEVGDDQSQLEPTLALMRQNGIAVDVIGVSAPFGRVVGPAQQSAESPSNPGKNAPSQVRQGPESRYLEMIDLTMLGSANDVMDSGFGPFALTRLCQESGGTYFACRDYGVAAAGGGCGGRTKVAFEPNALRRYAPDYVSEEEYQQILAGSKACKALHEAAKLPHADVLGNATTSFPKNDEASFKRALDAAQRDAAKFEPRLITLHDTLKQGEADRAKLTRPRWQAAYDLAMGRALAARVRTEGYNAMLAKLKSGGNFTKPGSSVWVLQESDTIGAGSAFEKMLDQSKIYLNRVVKDHPGTPWATLAESELQVRSGWQWTEQ